MPIKWAFLIVVTDWDLNIAFESKLNSLTRKMAHTTDWFDAIEKFVHFCHIFDSIRFDSMECILNCKLWILIHQLVLRTLRIKIHVSQLGLTNIYTFLICPFYSVHRGHSRRCRRGRADISHIAKQCQQLCQNPFTQSLSCFICLLHIYRT